MILDAGLAERVAQEFEVKLRDQNFGGVVIACKLASGVGKRYGYGAQP